MTHVVPDIVTNPNQVALSQRNHIAELAASANEHHLQAETASRTWIEEAVEVGRLLRELQTEVAPGEWSRWCGDNLTFSRPMAHVYLSAYFHRNDLGAGSTAADVRRLGAPPRLPSGRRSAPDSELRQHIEKLRADGLSLRAIGAEVGMSGQAVSRWLDPAVDRRARAGAVERRRRTAAAVRDAERALLARNIGGTPSVVYSDVRKLLQRLHGLAADGRSEHYREALSLLYRVEDAIVRGLRQERLSR